MAGLVTNKGTVIQGFSVDPNLVFEPQTLAANATFTINASSAVKLSALTMISFNCLSSGTTDYPLGIQIYYNGDSTKYTIKTDGIIINNSNITSITFKNTNAGSVVLYIEGA